MVGGAGPVYRGDMGRDQERRGWSAADYICPECKQPVQAVAHRRRKVLGVYVPVWEPGPCLNPECPRNPEARRRSEQAGPDVGERSSQPH